MSETNDLRLVAFNVKTKQKARPILNAVVKRTAKGAYIVSGNDDNGDKLTTLVNSTKAFAAIRAGLATAEGFEVPAEENQTATDDSKAAE